MTLAELNAHSARLYEKFYALKAEIHETQQWRNRRGVETDALRNIAEAQAQIENAKEIIAHATVIQTESIKSDEGFGFGRGIRGLFDKIAKSVK